MTKKLPIGILLFLMATLSSVVSAQQLKVGYVDPQTILTRMPEMKAVQQKLINFSEKQTNALRAKDAELQNAVAVYRQKEGAISESAKQTEQAQLQKMSDDLNQAQQKAQADVAAKRNELLGPLLNQIDLAITNVAKRMELSYVLNTTTNSGDLIILYASPDYQAKFDITEQVMVELGM